ncbi:NAD(P)-dependent oxidoreductase [Allobranchiibius sp. GilTou73]|uniref:NAD(P)-dependent oxidoreductase n=1 Tax=Allobranchiibius sp. GilTou73 TaxID=2904523 RepID=UPI001F389918|nr:NAD(P)-dependent oxidoreductase [Allobranchiibius sp. GilTou73]UIJ35903.1 NAD(P)-dependent oxidoreductase [Allobranchiibius sp. GilTou73]
MTEETTQRVAVLGTGVMGAGMAHALQRAGHDVVVWNRTRSKAEDVATEGISVADSVTDAVRGADVVVTILFDADAVVQVARELVPALGSDTVWLQSTTVGPAGIARIADESGSDRIVDAPMLGTKAPAEQGKLVALLSGPTALIDAARPALEAMTARSVVAGEALGKASALKLVCNAWIVSITAATAQSVALAEGLDIDPDLFLASIEGGPTDSAYAQLKGKAMIGADYSPSFAVDGALKDTGLIRDALAGAELRTDLADAVLALFTRTSTSGHGGDDMSAVRTAF